MTAFKAACVQLNSGSDMAANLQAAQTAIHAAAASGASGVKTRSRSVIASSASAYRSTEKSLGTSHGTIRT